MTTRPATETMYYLQNVGAGYIGNSPLFWPKSDSGYTQWIDDAKEWTRKDADDQIKSTRGTHTWKKWPVSKVKKLARLSVDIQALNK